jgi:prepilin-type N-terminal cleavage/methylation domain-containing protein
MASPGSCLQPRTPGPGPGHRRVHCRGGYTVVEMAIVIAVAGVLMTLAVWKTGPALQNARARQAAVTVAADLQYAQMLAARQREPMVVIVNPSLRLLLIQSRGGTVFRRRFVGPGTEFGLSALTVTPTTTVQVFPNGVATTTITITTSTPSYTRRVRLTRAGQIRILP